MMVVVVVWAVARRRAVESIFGFWFLIFAFCLDEWVDGGWVWFRLMIRVSLILIFLNE